MSRDTRRNTRPYFAKSTNSSHSSSARSFALRHMQEHASVSNESQRSPSAQGRTLNQSCNRSRFRLRRSI
ncbi:hypothetical protein CLOM_g16304 [Closterium sp. NIES-68]|nr:hypothetical protein CLOM_g16304 [Closterium sp. NIES-68]GJP70451.1 hypothetical protein CLOP_g1395 [Closterium sp. NIES-67]